MNENIKTVIFYGRSGSGKGTQAVLLRKFLEEHDEDTDTLYFETGKAFRELAEKDTVAGRLTKDVLDRGGLMPALLVVWLWGDYFINHVQENKHLILDGVARRPEEAPLVHDALKFFERKKTVIIVMNTSADWSFDRLKERGRYDDTDENIRKRLSWFDTETAQAIDYFRQHEGDYNIIDINGEQPIEKVHADILEALDLSHHTS